ncbi:MAG: GGDEF domain-containing protein, partial [Acidobacteria bacterium]|nr:GGDEF domain-containing protein [Acidobacteriota bacterium]
PNARSLQVQFEKEVGRAKRAGNSMQLLMLDLDGFKAVNDTFGHKMGDSMLKDVGRLIKAELRDYDFLARYGGDEFVAIVPETDNSDVIELCSRIETAVESYALTFNGSVLPVGVSVGSASYPTQGESFEDLLIAADKAMYRTKAFHKQRLVRLEETGHIWNAEKLEGNNVQRVDDQAVSAVVEMPMDTGLVVELDESHILTVNTIN